MEPIQIVTLKMHKTEDMMVEKAQILSPDDAASILFQYLDQPDREHFICMVLDTKHKVTMIHTVSIGTLDASLVHPREVFKVAILGNASGIIVAHNHPSGMTSSSPEDISITKRLMESGKILGIDVLDHIILGDDGQFTSLKSQGYM